MNKNEMNDFEMNNNKINDNKTNSNKMMEVNKSDCIKNLIIRQETEKDYYAAEYMTKRAFWNLHHPGCDEHYLVHVVRKSEDYIPSISRVAEIDGKIVGGIYYSKAYVLDGDKKIDVLNFGPLCVDPDYQNLGIGGRLLEESIKAAKAEGHKGIIIFGEPGYYPKHGFKTCDHYGITTKEGKNYDAFMGYEIVPGAFDEVTGKYYESEVFEQLYPEKVEEFDKKFPYMQKLKLPGQWD